MSEGGPCETPLLELLRQLPKDAVYQWQSGEFAHSSAPVGLYAHRAADQIERLQGALDFAPDEIPTNWLDPLLTGPKAIDFGDNGNPAIEKLLRALKERMRQYVKKALCNDNTNS